MGINLEVASTSDMTNSDESTSPGTIVKMIESHIDAPDCKQNIIKISQCIPKSFGTKTQTERHDYINLCISILVIFRSLTFNFNELLVCFLFCLSLNFTVYI
jgi:hypothetical protein